MMKKFTKISATGNDFILFDNRDKLFSGEERDFFRQICQRRVSVGADGVILIENSQEADFKYRHFNSDGGLAEMCGNGARGAAYYAFTRGIARNEMTFEVENVIHQARVEGNWVKLILPPPTDLNLNPRVVTEKDLEEGGFLKVGVPHLVLFTDTVDSVNVLELGRKYRYHPAFPKGTNVNFIQVLENNQIKIRTYERGVEAETLACGTGSVASAIIAKLKKGLAPPIEVLTKGGPLKVNFSDDWDQLALEGQVRIVYEGELWESC